MPHISPRKVNERVSKEIYKLLFSAIGSKNTPKKQQESAFGELLTPTEKIMLGKRLVAVSLLSQGISSYRVGKTLNLSQTTVAKFQIKLNNGKFLNTVKLCDLISKGPLQRYLENLFKPLPRYGTSPSKLFRNL